jgi:UDP-N-acetylglucosamine acyltransferase
MKNFIDPTAKLVGDIEVGFGNFIGPGCVITGPISIGNDNVFGPYSIIGGPPQDDQFGIEETNSFFANGGQGELSIKIGDRNVFREFVTVHHPFSTKTTIGSDNYFMTQSHIPHDACVADRIKLANSVQIGGYTSIMSDSYLGFGVVVHQFVSIGSFSMVGMSAIVTKDVAPGSKVAGSPARLIGPNVIGLEKAGVTDFSYWNHDSDSNGVPTPPIGLVEEFGSWNECISRLKEAKKLVAILRRNRSEIRADKHHG